MREMILENMLMDIQSKLANWARILKDENPNISEWMIQEINRIQIQLENPK